MTTSFISFKNKNPNKTFWDRFKIRQESRVKKKFKRFLENKTERTRFNFETSFLNNENYYFVIIFYEEIDKCLDYRTRC